MKEKKKSGGVKIKKTDLQKSVKMDDPCMEEFLQCNPKQIISDKLIVPVWRVFYSYLTARGNYKEAVKYMLNHHADWDIVERDFMDYINKDNEMHPERKISNVKILDMDFLGKAFFELE